MSVNRNIKIISFVVACAYVALGCRYAILQVFRREYFENRRYVRRDQQQRIHGYLAEGGVRQHDGKLSVDSAKVPSRDFPVVVSLLDNGFIRKSSKGPILDVNALTVSNPRLIHQREIAMRGSIRDRDGRLLAWSSMEDRNRVRHYTKPVLWFHAVGYMHPVFGKTGLEKSADPYLRGKGGGLRGIVTRVRTSVRGYDVITTLDSRLQEFASSQMNGKNGAVLVIAPETGEIMVCISSPAFDPESPRYAWNAATHDRYSAMVNRCWDTVYPPGSTFKVLVAAAALESKVIDRDQRLECSGYFRPIRGAPYAIHDFEWPRRTNWPGHNPGGAGWWTIEDAFIHSCNSSFAQIGLLLGAERLFHGAERFGFFEPIPIRLDTDGAAFFSRPSGIYHDISDPALLPPARFTTGSLAQTSIGQYETRVTVLQMALLLCGIANDGIMMKPTLVREVKDAEGATLMSCKPEKLAEPVSRGTAATLQQFLRKTAAYGTGRRAFRECDLIAGKTGTAQVPDKKPHSWFVGFAPHDTPEVVIVVIVENAGTGGAVAAPMAGRILKKYFENNFAAKETA